MLSFATKGGFAREVFDYRRELRRGQGCPARDEDNGQDTARISLSSQIGVFYVTGGFIVAAWLASVYEAVMFRRNKAKATHTHHGAKAVGEEADDNFLTDGEILRI